MPCTTAQHNYNKHIAQPTEPNCLLKEKTHVPINPRLTFINSKQTCSAMNKSTRIVLLCTVCVAAALASSFLTTDILVRPQVSGVPDSHSQDLPNLARRHKKQRLLQHHLSIHQRNRLRNPRQHLDQPAKQQNGYGLNLLP